MSTRLCGSVAVLSAMALCCFAQSQDVPLGEVRFTEYVAGQLRDEMQDATVVVKGPLTLAIGEMQANLDRIFAYCNRRPPGCAREISTYVKAVAQAHNDRFAPPSRDTVRVVVRTRAYVTTSQATLSKEAPLLQPRELAGGLVMLPAIDMPRTIRMLTAKDTMVLGLSTDEIFQIGLANLRMRLRPLMDVAKIARPGQIGYLSGDVYHSSRLALHESWLPLAKAHGGKLVVAAPATDTVLYIGDDTSAAIGALRALASSVWSRAPTQLSRELLRWTPKRWEVVR